MTSANVIEYTIFDKNDNEVGRHRQNLMCHTCNDGLEKFQPSSDFTIQAWGYDEEEDLWEDTKKVNLEEWLRKNPARITFKVFQPNDKVKISKKRGEGTILETIKEKWYHKYRVQLEDDTIIEVSQNEIIP